MQKRTFIKSLAAVTALSAIVLLTGCDEEKAVAEKPFRVGVTAGPHADIVTEAAKVAAKNGLKVEVVEFTDYVTPDTALNDGALDAAVYQHEPFLLNFNKQKGTKLANVGNAVVQPMGFYSNKVKSVADIPEGAVISVPNDPTNCGRGLLLLQAAGLIKLTEGMGSEASLADIVENKRNLKIRELEAAQLPRSLDDALVAVIPMNYVISASTSSPSRRRSRSSSSPRIRTAGTTRAFRTSSSTTARPKSRPSSKRPSTARSSRAGNHRLLRMTSLRARTDCLPSGPRRFP